MTVHPISRHAMRFRLLSVGSHKFASHVGAGTLKKFAIYSLVCHPTRRGKAGLAKHGYLVNAPTQVHLLRRWNDANTTNNGSQ